MAVKKLNGQRCIRTQEGSTLIEVIAVVCMLGVMAAVMLPKGRVLASDYPLNAEAARLAVNVANAKALARAWGRPLTLSVFGSSGPLSGYRVTCAQVSDGPCATTSAAVIEPGHPGGFSISLPGGLLFTSSSSVSFDALGVNASGAVFTLTKLGASINVAVDANTGKTSVY